MWTRSVQQLSSLSEQLAEGLDRFRRLLTGSGSPLTEEQLRKLTDDLWSTVQGILPAPVAGASTAAEVLGTAVPVFVLLFFILKDGRSMWRWLLDKTSVGVGDRIADAGAAAWYTTTGFARGTVVVALIDAVGIGVALVLIGVPLAMPLALLTFFGAFIPIVGATLAGAVAVLVALAANGPTGALLTAAAVVAVQQIEGNLLQPLVMRHQVRLHPAVILVAITAGTLVGGIAGAFVAVPHYGGDTRVISTVRSAPARTGPPEPAAGGAATSSNPRSPSSSGHSSS